MKSWFDIRSTVSAVRAWRSLRKRKAHAVALARVADSLSTPTALGPRLRNAEARAARLYRAAGRELRRNGFAIAAASGSEAAAQDPIAEAHQLLDSASASAHAALVRAAKRLLPWIVLAGVLIALSIQIPPVKTFFYPKNLTVRQPWRTSGPSFSGAPTSGRGPYAPKGDAYFFHTDEQDEPWIEVDLGSDKPIHALTVENRNDCCGERALPLVFETSLDQEHWSIVTRRRGEFSKWKATFPERLARYVRLRSERKTSLHLKAIKVY